MNYFILGTDTGVGKTVLSLLFMKYFFMKGETPFYIKPFQSGCIDPQSPDSDARFIYQNIPELRDKNPSSSVVYCLKEPKAPYYAAKSQGLALDPDHVHRIIKAREMENVPLIIEAAGGVFVPVTGDHLIIDLLPDMNAQPVVAARAGLGTINHTLLTLHALKSRGYAKPAVVFINSDQEDPAMIRENMDAIETYSGVRVSGVITVIDDFKRIPAPCLDVVEAAVDSLFQAERTSDAASLASKGLKSE